MPSRASAVAPASGRPAGRVVLFRADASPRIGSGHVIRCLALAAELERRGIAVAFASRSDSEDLSGLLPAGIERIPLSAPSPEEVEEIRRASAPAAGKSYSALVMDHYDLGEAWLRKARALAPKRFVIDDLANRPLPCEALVNPSPAVSGDDYASLVPPTAELLLGLRYVLLRDPFRTARAAGPRPAGRVDRILVSMGGGDPFDATARAVAAAREAVPEARVDVVFGALYDGPREFGAGVTTHTAIDAAAMADLLAASDIAIGAGGTSSWERCALGRPSVVVRLAPNQDANVDLLGSIGAAVDAGPAAALETGSLAALLRNMAADEAGRRSMIEAAWNLVDGRGVERVANRIDGVRLRRATFADARLLWTWANDPETRAASLHPEAIPFPDHERWLRARLADRSCLLLIGENGAGRLGQVRFDRREEGVEVSISVAREHRGTVGGMLLAAGLKRCRSWSPGSDLIARVKVDNAPSRRIFEAAGFRLAGERQGVLVYRASFAPAGAARPERVTS